ncbi:hypothetical protein EIP86_001119 [Pleurotus ostreatoroseus]|nr:hypothetical protein EIP86_001119 [Pleurotus ostreatoroseus]
MVHILSLSLALSAVLPPLASALPVASPLSISPATPPFSHSDPLTPDSTYAEHIPQVHGKRIDQITEDAAAPWKADCIDLLGQEICFNLAVTAAGSLLFAADVCAQQDAADQMISLAKSFAQNQTSQHQEGNGQDEGKGKKESSKADKSKEKSSAKEHSNQSNNATGLSTPPNPHGGLNATQAYLVKNMIDLAVIYAQQPRNTNNDFSVPYCQRRPNNTELVGIYHYCQFAGLSNTTYNIIGNPNSGKTIKLGKRGTIPFGMSTPVSPPGSCPSHPAGPVPANVQLVELLRPSGTAGAHAAAKGSHAAAKPAQATGAPSHH